MDLVKVNELFETFFVITEPAPTIELFPIVNGATNDELEPIKTLFPILVSVKLNNYFDYFDPMALWIISYNVVISKK